LHGIVLAHATALLVTKSSPVGRQPKGLIRSRRKCPVTGISSLGACECLQVPETSQCLQAQSADKSGWLHQRILVPDSPGHYSVVHVLRALSLCINQTLAFRRACPSRHTLTTGQRALSRDQESIFGLLRSCKVVEITCLPSRPRQNHRLALSEVEANEGGVPL